MRGFAAMCLARFRRSSAAVYEVLKGSDALCARRNLFCWGVFIGDWVIFCLGGVLSFSHECGYPRGLMRCLWWGCVMLSGFFVL